MTLYNYEPEFAIFIWPPHPSSREFPKNWQDGFRWHQEVQSVSCPSCGFQVKWIIEEEGFLDHNEEIRSDILQIFEIQHGQQKNPVHPWPGPTS